MWFTLEAGSCRQYRLVDRQSIWPAPDGTEAELSVTTDVTLQQDVILATPRAYRLQYSILALDASMVLGDQPPAPWPDASRITGRCFELMLIERGPQTVPREGEQLPNRLASWLETVSEGMRSCWPIPPTDAAPGTRWEAMPAVPGGLPPGARSANIRIRYQVNTIHNDIAELGVKFTIQTVLKPAPTSHRQRATGRGEVTVQMRQQGGLTKAARRGVIEIERPNQAHNQFLRNHMRCEEIC